VSFPSQLAHLFPYQPDRLVDTGNEMLICEVKAKNELGDPIVKAKNKVACRWANGAEKVAKLALANAPPRASIWRKVSQPWPESPYSNTDRRKISTLIMRQ
jgi:hypothetical protein